MVAAHAESSGTFPAVSHTLLTQAASPRVPWQVTVLSQPGAVV